MPGKGELTTLLTQNPTDRRKIAEFARSNKLDEAEIGSLHLSCLELKKKESILTIFHQACVRSKPNVVSALIKEGWSIHTKIQNLGTPLEFALNNGNLPVARLLIERGANVNSINSRGFTPIVSAINENKKGQKNCVGAVKLLLEAGVPVNAIVEKESKRKAIHIAVINNLPLVVSYLLQSGADGNALDINLNTPLHTAVQTNHLEIVKLLTAHKVDLYIRSKKGNTPILVGLNAHRTKAVEILVRGGCDVNKDITSCYASVSLPPLYIVVERIEVDLVKLLISLGADPNKQVASGQNAVHFLCLRNFADLTKNNDSISRLSILKILVENGANINVVDKQNLAPLHMAFQNGFMNLAKSLVTFGANVNFQIDSSCMLFHNVAVSNHDIIDLFLEFGADYNALSNDDLTPYHLAILANVDVKFIKSFVKNGCPYNQYLSVWLIVAEKCNKSVDSFFQAEIQFFKGIKENNLMLLQSATKSGAVPTGRSEEIVFPLHYAIFHGCKESAIFLLKENSPPNTVDGQRASALFTAAEQGDFEICCSLLKFGACYNLRCKSHRTPKQVAERSKHDSVVSLFNDVERLFHLARMSPRRAVQELEKKLKNGLDDFLIFANVINNRGDTLLATALRYNHTKYAKKMMKMRLENCN